MGHPKGILDPQGGEGDRVRSSKPLPPPSGMRGGKKLVQAGRRAMHRRWGVSQRGAGTQNPPSKPSSLP